MAHQRRVPSASAFLGILSLLLGAALWISLVAADSASSIVEPEVRNRILREGRLRVIVELRLPGGAHVPEGLLTGAGQSAQRRDIASVRLQVLSRLMGRNHSVRQQYSTVPMVSGVARNAQIMAVQVFSKFTNASDCGGSTPCALAGTSDIIAGLARCPGLSAGS